MKEKTNCSNSVTIITERRKMTLNKKEQTNSFIRWTLIVSGTIFVALGFIGVFLPLLPTTPFLLLAAACFAKSSEKSYHWLLNNRWFGEYIKNYQEKKAIPLKTKILALSLLWISILFSTLFVVPLFFVKILLILIAAAVSYHILSIKTLAKQEE